MKTSEISNQYKQIQCQQKVIQKKLQSHREWSVARFVDILPKRYVENRYQKKVYRNKYEVERIWDEKLQRTIDDIKKDLHKFPFLKSLPANVLTSRYGQIQKFNNINSEQCDEIVAIHFDGKQLKQELEDRAADSKLEREYHFLSLLFELIDKAENFNKN